MTGACLNARECAARAAAECRQHAEAHRESWRRARTEGDTEGVAFFRTLFAECVAEAERLERFAAGKR